MANCCLTGRTEKDTLINHVKWLSSWAVTMTKKVEALNELISAMTTVDNSEARRAIASASGRMVTYIDECTPEDPYGLKLLASQFERAKAMASDPSKIPCYENEKPEPPPTQPKEQPDEPGPGKLGALAKLLRFWMVADAPIPDIKITGAGTAEMLVKVQDIVSDTVLAKNANDIEEVRTALHDAGYECQVSITEEGADGKCGIVVQIDKTPEEQKEEVRE